MLEYIEWLSKQAASPNGSKKVTKHRGISSRLESIERDIRTHVDAFHKSIPAGMPELDARLKHHTEIEAFLHPSAYDIHDSLELGEKAKASYGKMMDESKRRLDGHFMKLDPSKRMAPHQITAFENATKANLPIVEKSFWTLPSNKKKSDFGKMYWKKLMGETKHNITSAVSSAKAPEQVSTQAIQTSFKAPNASMKSSFIDRAAKYLPKSTAGKAALIAGLGAVGVGGVLAAKKIFGKPGQEKSAGILAAGGQLVGAGKALVKNKLQGAKDTAKSIGERISKAKKTFTGNMKYTERKNLTNEAKMADRTKKTKEIAEANSKLPKPKTMLQKARPYALGATAGVGGGMILASSANQQQNQPY